MPGRRLKSSRDAKLNAGECPYASRAAKSCLCGAWPRAVLSGGYLRLPEQITLDASNNLVSYRLLSFVRGRT
jgi:hypothetical protein